MTRNIRTGSCARRGVLTHLRLAGLVAGLIGVVTASPSLAFGLDTHEQIVRTALAGQMSPGALDSVVGSWWLAEGNRGADQHQFTPSLHFDSAPDRLAICNHWRASIDTLLDSVVSTSDPTGVSTSDRLQQREAALQAFGQATHALGDFYSHSNYVELAYEHPELGLLDPDGLARIAPLSNNCDPNQLPPGLQTGYFNLAYGLDGCPGRIVAPEVDSPMMGEPSGLDPTASVTQPAPPAGFGYCHEQLAKDELESGHGADLVPGHGFTYHQVATLLATKATRTLWDTLRQRFHDRVDPSQWDADCLFDDLAFDRSSSAEPLAVRCRPTLSVPISGAPAPADSTRGVPTAACYARSAPLFASSKNFAEHDVALTNSSALIKAYVGGNTRGSGTRSWDVPGSRLCAGDQVQLTIRAGGQLALISRFWTTTGTTKSNSSLMRNFPPAWPERDFLAMAPGGDLGGTSGARTYQLTVTDFPFSIGVWVCSNQGDAGLVVWNYVLDRSGS